MQKALNSISILKS